MISKLDNPGKKKDREYHNKGSVGRLTNYLTNDKDKVNEKDMFFNYFKENMTKNEIIEMIDNNVKGLTKEDHKFFSFSINPSQDELNFIGNDIQKLKDFTKAVVSNITNSMSTEINKDELVWAAIIHENRLQTEEDYKLYLKKYNAEPNFQIGELKKGNNAHIHLILSAVTKDGSKVNILTRQNRVSRLFNLNKLQQSNQNRFQEMFFYKNGINIYAMQQAQIVANKLNSLNKKFHTTYDIKELIRVGDDMKWDRNFKKNFSYLIRDAYKKEKILNIETYLKIGPIEYNKHNPNEKSSFNEFDFNKSYHDYMDALFEKRFDEKIVQLINTKEDSNNYIPYKTLSNIKRKNKGKGLSRGL